MRIDWGLALAGCLLATLAVRSGRADTFVLKSGGQLEAEWLNRSETPRKSYQVRTPGGGTLTLAKDSVKDVLQQSEAEKRYVELLPRMPATADGNWKMAEWCRERSLTSLREQHLRAILEFEPDHEGARRGLGYSKIKGRWTTKEEVMRSQGYVRDGAVWRLPQEMEMVRAQSDAKQAELEWRAKLRMIRAKIGKKGGDRALEELRAIRDPAAAGPLVALLEDKGETPAMKLEYLQALGRLDSPASTNVIVQQVLNSDDERVRDMCLDFLEKRGNSRLTDLFVRKLKDDNATIVNRAAIALGRLRDPDATLPLIEALETKHKRVIVSGGGVSPQFGSDGSSSLSTGSSKTVVNEVVRHEAALEALAVIHPGTHFGYDKAAWKAWYVQTKTPRDVVLRRDQQ